ncbi:TIGR04326 family surface carbohydrate biosynthesis protein [Leptospira limi]|uniref:Uncharacterized protein n=1 Tax=Leptospira limi TaxID=2950023 RepID=A0ABT3LZ08_9LEPT|nr:TIGR04326 family surface carbohydrate biosynthesis protein [Leptospira limi]MCW7462958.1 hypothetical protein [Leptospira limi]
MINNKDSNSTTVLIWDQTDPPPKFEGITLLWNEFLEDKNSNLFSIPRLVEQNSDKYREFYLGLAHDLGEFKIKGRMIVDWLEIKPGLSFWWMTLIVENNYGKTLEIPNRIKFFALFDFLENREVNTLKIVTGNKLLYKSVKEYAAEKKVNFKFNFNDSSLAKSVFERIYSYFPLFSKVVLFFLHYTLIRWRFLFNSKQKYKPAKYVFINYFLNFSLGIEKGTPFSSDYWGKIIPALNQANISTHWLHFYVDYNLLPTVNKAVSLTKSFTQSERNQQHTLIDSYLSFSILFKSLIDYFKIYFISLKIGLIKKAFRYKKANIWELYKEDLIDSLRGRASLLNCIYVNLFSKISLDLVSSEKVFYLQENQSWEIALVHALQSKNIEVIGVPHATIRYWDLRYFYDPRSYVKEGHCPLPYPNQITINGPGAKSALLDSKFPKEKIIDVEALRYMFLSRFNNRKKTSVKRKTFLKMLVLGDYLPSATAKQMSVLQEAYSGVDNNIEITVKPHPICPVNKEDYPNIQFDVITDSLVDVLELFDLVYTSNITSASVDAYCAGLPVISFLDGETLNMSPLRGRKGVFFISNSTELDLAVQAAKEMKTSDLDIFFNLDENIPKWRQLLKL